MFHLFPWHDWSHRSWGATPGASLGRQHLPMGAACCLLPWEPRPALSPVLAAACPIPLPVLHAGLVITARSQWDIRAELAPSIPVHTQRWRAHHNNPVPGENLPTNLRDGEGSRVPKTPPTAPGRSSPVGLRRMRRIRSVAGIKERGSTSLSSLLVPCRVSGQGPSVIAACQSSCR